MRNFARWIRVLVLFTSVASSTAGAAVKAPPPYTVTASAGSGGSITPKGKVTLAAGSQQSFAIAPNTGYHIAAVKLDGVSKGVVATVTAPTDFAATKNNSHKLTAAFAINTYQVNVQSGDGGKVSIASKTVKYGTKLSFTVTPSKGYVISSISVGAPGATGTTPTGSYSKGIFKGTLTVTSDTNLAVSFAQQGSGGGGSGSTSGFTSSMLTGKTIYMVNPDGYSIFVFGSKGATVNGSSSVTSGTPQATLTATWKVLSDGSLQVSGASWSYTYALKVDSGTYWDVNETDKTGAASPARLFYGSGALDAAKAYYLATYGGGSPVATYFLNYALGADESSAAGLTSSACTGKTFYWADKSASSYGKYVFDSGSTSGTLKSTPISPAGAATTYDWNAVSLNYGNDTAPLNIAFNNGPHIVVAISSTYYYVCSNVDLITSQPPTGCSRWYFDNNGKGAALAKTYAGK